MRWLARIIVIGLLCVVIFLQISQLTETRVLNYVCQNQNKGTHHIRIEQPKKIKKMINDLFFEFETAGFYRTLFWKDSVNIKVIEGEYGTGSDFLTLQTPDKKWTWASLNYYTGNLEVNGHGGTNVPPGLYACRNALAQHPIP
jgi:hypothetical protein